MGAQLDLREMRLGKGSQVEAMSESGTGQAMEDRRREESTKQRGKPGSQGEK